MSDNETVADIVAEMRERADAMQTHGTTHGVRLAVHEFARRIEAAWKRQEQCYLDQIRDAVNMIGHERFMKEHPPVGNSAVMCDALLNIQEYAAAMDVDDGNVLAILDACRDALSAPASNCDVGTAEEQAQRYDQFCEENECSMCPVHAKWRQHFDVCKHEHISCGLIWAQMPYEAGEKGVCDER